MNSLMREESALFPPDVEKIEHRIHLVVGKLDELRGLRVEAYRAAALRCSGIHRGVVGCGGSQSVGETKLLHVHTYVAPYGCTGGDYWQSSGHAWVCNRCLKVVPLTEEDEKLVRPDMPELSPEDRKTNFKEVELGLPEDVACNEARRCLRCDIAG